MQSLCSLSRTDFHGAVLAAEDHQPAGGQQRQVSDRRHRLGAAGAAGQADQLHLQVQCKGQGPHLRVGGQQSQDISNHGLVSGIGCITSAACGGASDVSATLPRLQDSAVPACAAAAVTACP